MHCGSVFVVTLATVLMLLWPLKMLKLCHFSLKRRPMIEIVEINDMMEMLEMIYRYRLYRLDNIGLSRLE